MDFIQSLLISNNAVQQCTIFYATKSWVVRGLALYEITILLIIRSSIVRPKVNRDHWSSFHQGKSFLRTMLVRTNDHLPCLRMKNKLRFTGCPIVSSLYEIGHCNRHELLFDNTFSPSLICKKHGFVSKIWEINLYL